MDASRTIHPLARFEGDSNPTLSGAGGVPNFDFILFDNYKQQVQALLDLHIDVMWNSPIAHVMCKKQAAIVSLGMTDKTRITTLSLYA